MLCLEAQGTPDRAVALQRHGDVYSAVVIDEAGTNAIVGIGYHSIELAMTIPDGRRS